MKKRLLLLLAAFAMVASLTACGGKENAVEDVVVEFEGEEEPVEEEPGVEEIVVPEGFYRSELTNEIISEELKDQRPIAVMVDNESIALPHYGLTQADGPVSSLPSSRTLLQQAKSLSCQAKPNIRIPKL